MLDDDRVDVVHLTTPNHLHYPQVKAVLAAGKHVVCEKPLALDLRGVGRAAPARRGQRARPLHELQHPLLRARAGRRGRASRRGDIGAVHGVHGVYLQDWLLQPTDWNWRLDPGQGGALRAVADIGSHWLDLTQFVTGKRDRGRLRRPAHRASDAAACRPGRSRRSRATGTTSSASTARSTTEDIAHVLLRFEDGARGDVTISQVSAGPEELRSRFEVDGADGSLAWSRSGPRSSGSATATGRTSCSSATRRCWTRAPRRSPTTRPATPRASRTRSSSSTGRSTRAVEEGRMPAEPDYPTFADGHEEILLGEAIARSAAEERWIEVATVKLGLLTAALPDLSLERSPPGRPARASSRSRSRAGPAAEESGGATRASRTSTSTRFDPGEVRDDPRPARPRDLLARVLPEQPPPGRRAPRGGQRPPAQGDRRGGGARRRDRRHVRRQRQGPAAAGEPRALPPDLAATRRATPASAGVKIAIENCPMIFSEDEWPGGNNLAWSPAIWERDVRRRSRTRTSGSTSIPRTSSG